METATDIRKSDKCEVGPYRRLFFLSPDEVYLSGVWEADRTNMWKIVLLQYNQKDRTKHVQESFTLALRIVLNNIDPFGLFILYVILCDI